MASKTELFSIRLSRTTDELITREAKRTRRSKGAVIESLAEEALRTRRFPGIAFRGADWSRRPWVIGTALDVCEIVWAARGFDSPNAMAAETDLIEAQIRLVLAYYEERRDFPTIDTIYDG